MKFVRFGGLSPVKQKAYNPKMPSFHCAPCRRGIFAFVHPHIEYFLLGSRTFMPHRMEWVKDSNGNKVGSNHPEYNKYCTDRVSTVMLPEKKVAVDEPIPKVKDKDKEWFLANHVKPRFFDYNGEIWHHIPVKPYEIIVQKGSWTKSSMQNFKNALEREVGRIQSYKKRTGYGYMMDHFEVFIEKV